MKIDKSWYIKPKGIQDRLVAGGMVIRKEGDKRLLLLIRGNGSSKYALPKGGVTKGENIEEGARREVREESGIDKVNLITELGVTERLTMEKDYWSICHFFLFTTDQVSGEQDLQEDEDFVAEWFDIDNLPEFFWPEQEKMVKDNLEKIKKIAI